MISTKICSVAEFSHVSFNILGNDQIKDKSVVQILSDDLNKDNGPYPGGVYDAHLGTLSDEYKCATCNNNKRNCIGHFGYIDLNYPIWNPLFSNEARKWLKLICHNPQCYKPILSTKIIKSFDISDRLVSAVNVAKNGNKKCVHCQETHYIIKRDKLKPMILIGNKMIDNKISETKIYYPHMILKILNGITDDIVTLMGKSINSHPRLSFISRIIVPPVAIRPETKRSQSSTKRNVTTDQLTITLQVIIKKNSMLPTSLNTDNIDGKTENIISDINILYNEYVKATKEGSISSLTSRIKGKTGHCRKNILGKRVFRMCRSTIVGDSSLEIDEIGIPLSFAQTVQVCEVMQDYNRSKLMEYINNGRKKYPGATIVKKKNGKEHNIEIYNGEYENGDTIYRDLIDGDVVGFNRQPSLAISSIGTHRIKVTLDPEIKTIRMNVLACPLYNADFDGDQMNLIIYASDAARSEISLLSSIPNWMISHTTSNPLIGQVDDSIIGLAELTRHNVKLDKYHAMLLFSRTTKLPSFSNIKEISGRDCITAILSDMNINYKRTPTWYLENYSHIINYHKDDISVVIENGKHISGILDKASIGKGAKGSLYDVISREYGPKKALKVIFDMQQIAIAYNTQINGFSMGIMDMIVPKETKDDINKIATDMINKSQLITDEFIRGEMVPPIGETISSFYEKSQIKALSSFGMFDETILKSIDHYTNNLYKLVAFGSKGSFNNLYNINSVIGQRLINGERVSEKFGPSRTLPYFPRFDTNPIARGYSPNSYLAGTNPAEYVWGSMGARFDMISKALSTATTGDMERKSIKCLESIIISNMLQALKFSKIIQFMYGEDGMDVRHIETIQLPTIMISDSEFEKKYKHNKYPKIFETMLNDRKKYRSIFLKLENTMLNELMTNIRKVPINIERLINSVCSVMNKVDHEVSDKTLDEMTNDVEQFCDNMKYLFTNENMEKKKIKLPQYYEDAVWILKILIRSHLCPNMLLHYRLSKESLHNILLKIKIIFIQSICNAGTPIGIITAQCFSEPLVQYMLDAHHRSASGGTSKSGMTNAKEVLEAKDLSSLVNPSMLIPVLDQYCRDKSKVQEIANNIEQMKLSRFVVSYMHFVEPYGKPTHPEFAHESELIASFNKNNPLIHPPGDLVYHCIRYELNRNELILKNMTVQFIVNKLRILYQNIYIVYTSENAKNIIMRIYMRNNMFKHGVTKNIINEYSDMFLNTIIRGIDNIMNTDVIELVRNKINEDGSISQDSGKYGIITSGSNLPQVMLNEFVDQYAVQTDSVLEVAECLGIEAARTKLVQQLRGLINTCSHRHYLLYADEMTSTGKVTGITLGGLVERENNTLLHMGFSSPISSLEIALSENKTNMISGITGKLMVGAVPSCGTFYNSLQVNPDIILKNIKKVDDVIDDLFS